MKTLSATCVAIACAIKAGSLQLVERDGRFGAYVAIEDEFGLIEVADDMAEAKARVSDIEARIA